jgi:hypothetical protein
MEESEKVEKMAQNSAINYEKDLNICYDNKQRQ